MQYRTLGKTGWKVSAISMGCWALGGQWGEVGERQTIETVHAAIDAGVNLFDTADVYGDGLSEIRVGKALKGRRDDVFIASKAGNWGRGKHDHPPYCSPLSIINCCDASLYRLKTDYIDLYQCHLMNPEHPEAFVEAFEQLKEQGKIRHYGISTNDLSAAEAINTNSQCAVCQIRYSILDRAAENNILPWCHANNVGVLLKAPLAQGRLSGKFDHSATFNDSVRRSWNEGEGRSRFQQSLEKIEKLRPLTNDSRTMVDVALRFLLANPAVTCPIPGMKDPKQAHQNAAAANGELSPEDLKAIDAVFAPGTVA